MGRGKDIQPRKKKGAGINYVPFFQSRKEEIIELLRDGNDPYRIAKKYELSWKQIHTYGSDAGLKVLTKSGQKREKRNREIRAMVLEGTEMSVIGKKFRVSPERIRQILEDNNMVMPHEIRDFNYSVIRDRVLEAVENMEDLTPIYEQYGGSNKVYMLLNQYFGIKLGTNIRNRKDREIWRLFEEGIELSKIARQFEMSGSSVSHAITRKFGKKAATKRYLKRNNAIVKDMNRGIEVEKVALKYNLGPSAIYYICQKRAKSQGTERMPWEKYPSKKKK